MFSHVMLGCSDRERSKKFYDATLGALGFAPGSDFGKSDWWGNKDASLGIGQPLDGKPCSHGNGSTIGIKAESPEAVDAWHAAGLANGGTAVEDPPGIRDAGFGKMYLAYLRDPDGNKLCGYYPDSEGAVSLEIVSENRAHGGRQLVVKHASSATGTDMTFSIFLPPQAEARPCPIVWYFSGLTCTHANVTEKGEYRGACAEHGLIFVAPDTSPRGDEVPDGEGYDFGKGAGFYVDATQRPWSQHYRMWSYVTEELPALIAAEYPVDMDRQGITGHSMGGHGALTVALNHPDRFRSVSAFAPIVAPGQVPWGQKALGGYLGEDRATWRKHDAVALIEDGARVAELLVDVGTGDSFLEKELRPELLERACADAGIALTLGRREGYDHSYYFISTFMADHLAWHAERLRA